MRHISLALILPVLISCSDPVITYTEFKPTQASSAASGPVNHLILPPEVDLQVAESFIRIGFGIDKSQRFQSTEFLTPRLRTSQAGPLIRLVDTYNEFNGEHVAHAVEKLKGRVSGVEFGREGSPVLYIELPYWTHQREEYAQSGTGTKISDAETEKLISELRQAFVDGLRADEFSVSRRRVRIWWD